MDSEFYKKENLQANDLITSISHKQFGEIIDVLTDYHANGSYETLREHVILLDYPEFAHMVRITDLIKDDFEKDVINITKNAYEHLSKTKLYGGEILINKIGTYAGQSFLMPNVKRPSSLGMNIFMLRLKKGFSSKLYQIFLLTKIGKTLIDQKISGASPKSIDKESVREVTVPIFSNSFQECIENLIDEAQNLKQVQKEAFLRAEEFLLKQLGLKNFQTSKEPVNVKSFSESFGTSGRLDAEYYQKKYDEIIEIIQSKHHDKISNLVKIQKSIEPGSKEYQDEGIPFYRVADIDKQGLSKPDKYLSESYVSALKAIYKKRNEGKTDEEKEYIIPKKGTILFSKDGSIGKAYKLREDLDGMSSGALLHLTIKDSRIDPDYLTLVLNSLPIQMQAERDAGGSIIQHWRINEIENVVVPLIQKEKQEQIAEFINESFDLKQQSEHLLEIAKRAVEHAIEKGEETALAYIKSETIKFEK